MDPQELLDVAFSRASKTASLTKSKVRGMKKYTMADLDRIKIVIKTITDRLENIVKRANPKFDEFQKELLYLQVNKREVKKEEKQIKRTLKILKRMSLEFQVKIKFCEQRGLSNKYRQQFYGRVSSLVEKLRISELEKIPIAARSIPRLRDFRTLLIIGFPNVGKSSILNSLCGANVEIQSYPFTTKGIGIGYFNYRYEKVQVLDTPGMLDRPFDKMNKFEKEAFIALKHTTNKIIFVIDPSETCGYSLKRQEQLLKQTKKHFTKANFLIVATKKDISAIEYKKADVFINSLKKTDIQLLKDKIIERFIK